MIAAEEWHKHQENYVKYGVELAPEMPRPKKKAAKKNAVKVTPKEKVTILMLIAAVGVCCVMIIFFQACASKINYSVYTLNQEIEDLSGDISNLQAEINGYNNLEDVESRAKNDLMMVYPEHEQYVYLGGLEGSREVEDYIASLTAAQKGIIIEKNVTVVVAARHLLERA